MKQVTIYTGINCRACDTLKSFMTVEKIDYQEVSIHEDPNAREKLIEWGVKSIPVTVVDGHEPIVGLSLGAIKKAVRG